MLVNRVWQHHFGRGLVATASNFGALGERPTHPELLDWLAARFVATGWSLKALHREILLSATYQQSSRFDARAHEIDPANTLLWRMNRRRLEVEAWRDAMLAVAGRLDPGIGGPSVSLDAPGNRPPDLLRGDQPPRPGAAASPLRLPRPQHHQRRTRRDHGAAPAAFRAQQRVHGPDARALVRPARRGFKLGGTTMPRTSARPTCWLYGRAPTEREIELGLSFLVRIASETTCFVERLEIGTTASHGTDGNPGPSSRPHSLGTIRPGLARRQ